MKTKQNYEYKNYEHGRNMPHHSNMETTDPKSIFGFMLAVFAGVFGDIVTVDLFKYLLWAVSLIAGGTTIIRNVWGKSILELWRDRKMKIKKTE